MANKKKKTLKEKIKEKWEASKDWTPGDLPKEAFMTGMQPPKEYSTTRPSGLRGGGRATRGLGKAFMKGGRAK